MRQPRVGERATLLVDMACHTATERDAALQPGWTFMTENSAVAITVLQIDGNTATIRVRGVGAGTAAEAEVLKLADFTDGVCTCPRAEATGRLSSTRSRRS